MWLKIFQLNDVHQIISYTKSTKIKNDILFVYDVRPRQVIFPNELKFYRWLSNSSCEYFVSFWFEGRKKKRETKLLGRIFCMNRCCQIQMIYTVSWVEILLSRASQTNIKMVTMEILDRLLSGCT